MERDAGPKTGPVLDPGLMREVRRSKRIRRNNERGSLMGWHLSEL